MRLTVEQQARCFAEHGVCANEACDKCGKVLAEVCWTRRDTPETYCSQVCRDGVERGIGRCDGCGVDLAGKRRGARWCSDTCRMRHRVKDSANNPKTYTQKNGLTGTEIGDGCGIDAGNLSLRKRRGWRGLVSFIPLGPGASVENPRGGAPQSGPETNVGAIFPRN